MRIFLLFFLFCRVLTIKAQTSYSGYIDRYPVQLVTYVYSDGDARAIYAYDKFDTPMRIDGKLSGKTLELFEFENGEVSATFKFEDFDEKADTLKGIWVDKDQTKKFVVTLKKDFEIEYGEEVEWAEREIIQPVSLENNYFKLLVSKNKGDFYATVSGVKILEKKTDRLIQTIELDCELWGLDNISTGDYNFDGVEDFSVFESSYAGPNTSSIYILRIPDSEKYFISNISGISLEFDPGSKTIYEHNQCCAGTRHMNATYTVENNEMILINQNCMEYDEEKEDFVDVPCE